jgi:precorrin-2 dehydrogenase/sirohydrochlorin ferrochelatase
MTTKQTQPPYLFPLFIRLAGRPCLIAGGGKVAGRKVDGLLEAGASVTVVSPEASAQIQTLASQGRIAWRQKTFSTDDLHGSFLVIAATGDAAANGHIAACCRAHGILINVVDEPLLCDFFVPSVLRRGALSIAIATEGKSPLLASKLRTELEQIVTEPYGEFLELLGRQRELIKNTVPDSDRREAIFRSLVYSDILDLLAAGKQDEAQERIRQCISSQQD